jgi:hypothetical protein
MAGTGPSSGLTATGSGWDSCTLAGGPGGRR